MRPFMLSALVIVVVSAPAFAQEPTFTDSRAYASVSGGFASALGHTTGDFLVEGGVRVAPHLKVIGDLGRFHSLSGDLQPTLDMTASSLSANGLGVTSSASVPAWYGLGGLRLDVPTRTRIVPYVLGGVGVARLAPTPQFLFANGALPDGTTPSVGTDVTSSITSTGLFATPAASTGWMSMIGGGVQVPVAPRFGVDVGYRYSRIAADATLSATPLNANGMTFGLNYRF